MPSSYTLGEHLENFVADQVASGRYSSASEVIRAGLRLLDNQEQERTARLKALRAEIQDGLDDLENGRYQDFKTKEELDAFFEDIHNRGMEGLLAQTSD